MISIFLIPDFTSMLEIAGKIFFAFASLGAAAYGLYAGIRRAKERGAKEERERQEFITREVERQVTAHRESYEERIALLKEALDSVKTVADFTGRRLQLQETELAENKTQIAELRAEIRRLKTEHDAAVSRAFELQGQLDAIIKNQQ